MVKLRELNVITKTIYTDQTKYIDFDLDTLVCNEIYTNLNISDIGAKKGLLL